MLMLIDAMVGGSKPSFPFQGKEGIKMAEMQKPLGFILFPALNGFPLALMRPLKPVFGFFVVDS